MTQIAPVVYLVAALMLVAIKVSSVKRASGETPGCVGLVGLTLVYWIGSSIALFPILWLIRPRFVLSDQVEDRVPRPEEGFSESTQVRMVSAAILCFSVMLIWSAIDANPAPRSIEYPIVSNVLPADGDVGVEADSIVKIEFNKPLKSVNDVSFSNVYVIENETSLRVDSLLSIAADKQSVTLEPREPLNAGAIYQVHAPVRLVASQEDNSDVSTQVVSTFTVAQ